MHRGVDSVVQSSCSSHCRCFSPRPRCPSLSRSPAGEKLITKGEYATFCGIVLQGTFSAIVTPTFTVALGPGEMVGEMSLFEGGARNADIITGTDEAGCILAVITFADLDNLTMNERYSALARKLTMLFATASIRKLRGMLKPAPSAATATAPTVVPGGAPTTGTTAADAATTATPAATTATTATPAATTTAAAASTTAATPATSSATPAAAATTAPAAGAPAAAAAGAAPVKKERIKKQAKAAVVAETLYKNKMNAAESAAKKTAAHAGTGGSASGVALGPDGKPVRATNINEAQKELEEKEYRLKKVEHAKRNQQVMLDKASKLVRAHEETIQRHEDSISRLQWELKTAQEISKELGIKYNNTAKSLEDTTAALERETTSRKDVESKLQSSASDYQTRMENEVARLTAELATMTTAKQEAESALANEKATLGSALSAKEAECAKWNAAATTLTAEVETLKKDLSSTRTRLESLESDHASLTKLSEDQKLALSSLSAKILDLEEKLAAAMSWKLKALEFQSGLDAEKKRHVRLAAEWAKREGELSHELRQYKTLLKVFSVSIYAKEHRVRKLIGTLHKRVSEMLLTTLEEHYSTATGREKNMASNASAAAVAGGQSSGALKGGAGGGGGSTVGSIGASTASTFKSVRKRKKLYLDNLLRPSSKLRDIVLSLEDEVSKLRGPFEEIRERCLHWRATSESFFQRNIDLASRLMTLDKSLADSSAIQSSLTSQVKHASKELERARSQQQQAEERSQRGGGAKGDDKDHSKVSLGASKQELEMLEARCTVLRVHVQQLEQHYLNLQLAIHTANTNGSGFQESKESSSLPKHLHAAPVGGDGERFDPALVSPLPLAPYGTPAQQAQQLALASAQAQRAAANAGTAYPSGAMSARGSNGAYALQAAPPSMAPLGYGYQFGPAAAAAAMPGARAPAPLQGPSGSYPYYQFSVPLSPPAGAKPDVVSLRALQLQQQQQAAAAKLPAVAGAQAYAPPPPAAASATGGASSYPVMPHTYPLHPYPPQAATTIATPQRTTISFSPRGAV